jgi:putative ABC transport system substrate-binding protein
MIHPRFTLVLGLALAVIVLGGRPPVLAQAPKLSRIGAVSAGAPRSSPHWVAFEQRLRELGLVEGRDSAVEFRSAEGKPERFPGILTELVAQGVDVILAVGP